MSIILIDHWQVLSYLIRMSLLNQANHAIWQKSWSTSIVLTVFPWILEVNASKEEKKLVRFRTRLQDERKIDKTDDKRQNRQNRFGKEWSLKLAESDKGYYYNQEKWLKVTKLLKNHWNRRGIEFNDFLSERGKLFWPRSGRASDEVTRGPASYKNRTKDCFLKSIVAGGKLQEKLQEAICCQFFQGSVQLLENVSSTSGLGSTWLVRCENEICPSQI